MNRKVKKASRKPGSRKPGSRKPGSRKPVIPELEIGETYIFSLKREDPQLPAIKGLLKAKVLSKKGGKRYILQPLVTPINLIGYSTQFYVEIEHSALHPGLYIGDLDYRLIPKKRLRLRMNRPVTEKEIRELGELYKPERPNVEEIRAFYLQLRDSGVSIEDIKNLIASFQEATPVPILGKIFPRSNRGYTTMTRLLGRKPSKIPSGVDVLNTFQIQPWCFCLEHESGPIEGSIAIPITRYGLDPDTGYYTRQPLKNPNFTWYYVEPDSELLLLANKAYVAKNKFDMALRLYGEIAGGTTYFDDVMSMEEEDYIIDEDGVREYLKSTGEKYSRKRVEEILNMYHLYNSWKNLYGPNGSHLRSELERCFGDIPEEIDIFDAITEDEERTITGSRTTYFRDIKTGKICFEGGEMDDYDPIISSFARLLEIDVLIFTRQPGTYGRLVSECLDIRPRSESFKSIYHR